jgi:murein DD-endopeptidase MepM/ murein hydrolase activator NlpD
MAGKIGRSGTNAKHATLRAVRQYEFFMTNFYRFIFGLALVWLWQTAIADTAALKVHGQWEQGGILFGQVAPGSQVRFAERVVRVTDTGDFVIGLGPDAPAEAVVEVTDSTGQKSHHSFVVVQRQYQVQHVNGVEQKHVTPPPELTERIAREAELVSVARNRDDARQDFLQDFIWPLSGPITGVYGSRRVYNGTPRAPHYGLDIAGPVGAHVVAPAAGLVTLTENDLFYSGGTLIVDHGHGLSSTFIHLSKILVKPGDRVEQGQAIAEVGATGRVTGPHLDWRMNWFEIRLDPALLMAGKSMPGPALGTAEK